MSIKALDKITVKQLTTAQIITSVFSAVKELVENALDAGANSIDVILEEQGLSFIEVRDNANGISEADSSFIALPAYTSKLLNFSGLESLETYGFRGEALNALCRVSDVKIITRTVKDDTARCYIMDHNGNIAQRELCARPIGTTIQVSSLLKNIPVRRKIISNRKNVIQDIEAIESLLQDFGICHPKIRFNYRVDNINRFTKLPAETIKESLNNIFNKKIILNYEFLCFNDSNVNIELIIPKKDLNDISLVCQKNYSHIYINNRPVLYKEFEKLVIALLSKHYDEKISGKKKPIFFIIIKVSSSDVDVNLEPNKTKVLLKNSSKILETVEKLLLDYYEILKSNEIGMKDVSALTDESSVLFMDDFKSDDEEDIAEKLPLCKKRKVENTKAQVPVNDTRNKIITENKENIEQFVNELNIPQLEEETPSQLPNVDLGPDFSTQEIADIPVLNPECVQNVIDKLGEANVQPKLSNVPESPEVQAQFSKLQWSKGHRNNLKGGTDVEVYGPSSGLKKKKREIHESTTNPSTRGFLKFSEKMGQQLHEENPGIDFVTIATSIATKWKQLTKEEREYYRELGRQDILTDSKLNVSREKKRFQVTPDDAENNKEKLRNMIQKMGILATSGDDKKNDNSKNTANGHNKKIRDIRNWEINKKQLINSYQHEIYNNQNSSPIIGPVINNIWAVRTNSQIWALNLNKLFDALNLENSERTNVEEKSELIEIYFKRGLDETDNTNFMYPIYPK